MNTEDSVNFDEIIVGGLEPQTWYAFVQGQLELLRSHVQEREEQIQESVHDYEISKVVTDVEDRDDEYPIVILEEHLGIEGPGLLSFFSGSGVFSGSATGENIGAPMPSRHILSQSRRRSCSSSLILSSHAASSLSHKADSASWRALDIHGNHFITSLLIQMWAFCIQMWAFCVVQQLRSEWNAEVKNTVSLLPHRVLAHS